ncbi:MAG TPA: non-canonical purine NTP pyrophosphatase [Pyrinomonadaceae bacterium]|nr:non-canonical purine NTP pyrophosphatase [Pyrinomonadaceae bacterium]
MKAPAAKDSGMTKVELLIATRNEGKVDELRETFEPLPVALRFLSDFQNISEVAEVGNTYLENATLKASGYARQTALTALADDSGLEVEALGGRPSVLSARLGGDHLTDIERTRLLLALLDQSGIASRKAQFVCYMVLYGSLGARKAELSAPRVLAVTQGICEGSLAYEPIGKDGFGFDPIFIPNGYTVPFAVLDQAVKRRISHRARAAQAMRGQVNLLLHQT